jgi:hypothetical protein
MASHRIDKATYNDKRERSYEKEARDTAWKMGKEIEVDSEAAYLVANGGRELLCRPTVPKHFWYEAWLAIKGRENG